MWEALCKTSTLCASLSKLTPARRHELVRPFVLRAVSPRGACRGPASRTTTLNNTRAVRMKPFKAHFLPEKQRFPSQPREPLTAEVNVTRQFDLQRAE